MPNYLKDIRFSNFMRDHITIDSKESIATQLEYILQQDKRIKAHTIPKKESSITINAHGTCNLVIHTKSKKNAYWVYEELLKPYGICISSIDWRCTKYGFVYNTKIVE